MPYVRSAPVHLFFGLLRQVKGVAWLIRFSDNFFVLHPYENCLLGLALQSSHIVLRLVLKSHAPKYLSFTFGVVLLVHLFLTPEIALALAKKSALPLTLLEAILLRTTQIRFRRFVHLLQNLERSHVEFGETTISP